MSYRIEWSRSARRALEHDLPEAVGIACLEFILGPLSENPHRVGKPLREPLAGFHSGRRGEFRVIYQIREEAVAILIASIRHRRDAYK